MRPPTETTPDLDLTAADVREFLAELEQYRGLYHDLFYRCEQREQYDTYLHGLLSTLPNKSVETMVLPMHGDDPNAIRSTQHFISEGRWSDRAIIARHWTEVARDLGDANRVIIVDDTGFPKQGQDSVGILPSWTPGRGQQSTTERLAPGEPDAAELRTIPTTLPPEAWSRHTIKEGRKGPLVADFAFLRVVAVRNQLPGPDVWLIARSGREVTSDEYKFYLSNAPCETSLDTFVWLAGTRWPIETCFEAGKQDLGLGDYQLRSWTGWHHHMTVCTGLPVAHFFLVQLQLRLKHKAPDLTLPHASRMLLLKSVLPQPHLDVEQALEIVGYYQRRHHAAYLSHRKRRLKRRR